MEVSTGRLFTAPFEASVKARYADDFRQLVDPLVSENVTLQPPNGTLVPEPSSLALVGVGLVLLGARRGRRR